MLAPSLVPGASGSEPRGGAAADLAEQAEVVAATQRVGRPVAQAAAGRTTSVSAALLVHAALGRLADPAIGLVRSWTSYAGLRVGSLPAPAQDPTQNTQNTPNTPDTPDTFIVRATDRLLAVGSSFGRDLARGLLAAADLLTGTRVTSTPPAPPRPHAPVRPSTSSEPTS